MRLLIPWAICISLWIASKLRQIFALDIPFSTAGTAHNKSQHDDCPMALGFDFLYSPFLRRNEYTGVTSGIFLEIVLFSLQGCERPRIVQLPSDRGQ